MFTLYQVSHVMHHVSHVRFQVSGVTCHACPVYQIFKASALWADAFYKSICPSVCLSVRPYVCLSVSSLLRYCLNVFFPPLPEVRCPICFEIRNPWGKVMDRKGLIFEHFCLKIVKNCRTIFFLLLILPKKTWWKPRFPMD